MHKSRLGQIIIDCQTDDVEREAAFWASALGARPERVADRYVWLHGKPNEPQVIIQRVEHESRVHIDIETDDFDAEVRRLEGLGAGVVEHRKRWVVMAAPSGQRFCVVKKRRPDFEEHANQWG